MDRQIVYFFDEIPTIGFCSKCEETAVYGAEVGLACPKCRTRELSIFVWDGKSTHPGA